MWPTLKQMNDKFSIGRHTSLYEIGIALATYLRGHTKHGVHFGYWDSMNVGEWGVYKNKSMLGAGNVRKSLQVGVMCVCVCVWVEVGVLVLVHGIPLPKCFPRQISHAF